jgi:hypothetical protein
MALTLNSPVYVADWLKYESPSYHSRDTATIASGSGVLVSGTVLAKVTATGKYVPAAATGADGSQTAVACLITPVDATSADVKAVILTRHADVSHAGITYGPTITDATKRATVQTQLAAVGIVTREGA